MGVEGQTFDTGQEPREGPSWQRSNWPLDVADDLNAALDPTRMGVEVKAAAEARGEPLSGAEIEKAAADSIRAMMLIRTYRVRGHLASDLDPLGLSQRELPADLTPEYHGFAEADLDREVYLGGNLGVDYATIRDLVDMLRTDYCGPVGLEYMHISDIEERRFLQERLEGKENAISFTAEGKKAILNKVIQGEQFESFLGKKYVGTKRFGLDGGEAMLPALEAVIKYGGQYGVREIVYGMSHRGRLNVLANVMAKPYRVIFHEFQGGSANPKDVGGSGDVKYHLGTSTDREFDGITVHMSLVPNPSHLEAVDPVVLGKVRAQQVMRQDTGRHEQVLPVLIHGDAAFAGQGIVWETLSFSGIRGYNTGGCVHFVINNQIGFTTSPQFARSSPYPSDVAKGVQAPIFHVNGDESRSGHLRLQDGDRVPPALRPGHRDRHVVLSPLRPQRRRRTELHPAADVQGDQIASQGQPGLRQAPRIRRGDRRRLGRADHPRLCRSSSGRVRRVGKLQGQPGRLVRRPLVRPSRAGRQGNRAAQRADRDRAQVARFARSHIDRGARRPPHPQDAGPHPGSQEGDVRERREFRLGRPARLWPSARSSPKAMACACPARIRGAARSASATRSGSIRRTSKSTRRFRKSRMAASMCSTARCPNMACSASNMAMRWPTPRR